MRGTTGNTIKKQIRWRWPTKWHFVTISSQFLPPVTVSAATEKQRPICSRFFTGAPATSLLPLLLIFLMQLQLQLNIKNGSVTGIRCPGVEKQIFFLATPGCFRKHFDSSLFSKVGAVVSEKTTTNACYRLFSPLLRSLTISIPYFERGV